MTDLKAKLDAEFSHINLNATEEEIIIKANRKPSYSPTLPRLVAAAIVLVLLAGICFAPNLFSSQDNGFMIVANAQTLDDAGIAAADEITSEGFVELNSVGNSVVFFDFNNTLNSDAEYDNMVKKYLFHSFAKLLHIDVVGENIEKVTYKLSEGTICVDKVSAKDRYQYMYYNYPEAVIEFTVDYDKQDNYQLAFNPVNISDSEYELVYVIQEYNEAGEPIAKEYTDDYLKASTNAIKELGRGFRTSAPPVATEEEIAMLKEYIAQDDMVGFFNYQSEIFARIVNDITLDITVTKTNGTEETKTLQLRYTPIKITDASDYLDYQLVTPSAGTISAKLIKN